MEHRCRRLAEKAVDIPVACDDDAFAVKNPGSPLGREILIPQDRGKTGWVKRHRKHIGDLAIAEDRYPDRQDRPLQHRAHEEVRDVRFTRPDDALDHAAVGLAGGQLAIGPGGAAELLRMGVVEANRKPLDLERLSDLARKGLHIALLEAGGTREDLQRNLNASDLAVDVSEQVFQSFPYVALDLRSLVVDGAENGKGRERDQGQ